MGIVLRAGVDPSLNTLGAITLSFIINNRDVISGSIGWFRTNSIVQRKITILYLGHPIGDLIGQNNTFNHPKRTAVLNIEVLRRMDVRHVLEASIARGLGLTEDVVVAVVGIYMCPTDPECANNRGRRRRRSRRLGESYVNNTEKISTPTPSTSNTKTSIYRRRHLLQDETWIEV